jgi:hypothetical protein
MLLYAAAANLLSFDGFTTQTIIDSIGGSKEKNFTTTLSKINVYPKKAPNCYCLIFDFCSSSEAMFAQFFCWSVVQLLFNEK